MKRVFDTFTSMLAIVLLLPIISIAAIIVWVQDLHSPFYIASRLGKNGKTFKMIKLRTMKISSQNGASSTSENDPRITTIGRWLRKLKIDELPQLFNVFLGDMSLVGPRPNFPWVLSVYTEEEKNLLKVTPGITDFASIVFSDEGEILKDSKNPDADYDNLIRPWKSRLGLFYIENKSFILDLKIIFITAFLIFSRKKALQWTSNLLLKLNAPRDLVELSRRTAPLR